MKKAAGVFAAMLGVVTPVFLLAQNMQDQAGAVHDALQVQKARAAHIANAPKAPLYDSNRFPLDDLPPYSPAVEISGPIHLYASDLLGHPGFQEALTTAFLKFHRKATLEFTGGSPGLAFAGILTGLGDVAIARRMTWVDVLSFERKFNRDPIVIRGMTGWDVNPPFVIAVNKDNPIAHLSIAQLDGIFGAARSGGWDGETWDPSLARGPEKNIRTGGQLGLKGEWANKPIHVFGYNFNYVFVPRFSTDVLKGSNQWNEHLQQFTIHSDTAGNLISADQQMADAVGKDRYAIAYYTPGRGISANTRAVPIELADGRAVPLNLDTVRTHSYPLYDSMWFYATRKDDGSIDPKVREFLMFILSREGQAEVARDTTMLPLTAADVEEERKNLR